VLEYARVLEGVRVEVPVVGSRLAARLDLSKVDTAALVRRAAQALLKEKLRGGLEDVLDKTAPPAPDEPGSRPEPRSREERLRRGLLDLLEKVLRRDEKEND
jgi:hypothetical protein